MHISAILNSKKLLLRLAFIILYNTVMVPKRVTSNSSILLTHLLREKSTKHATFVQELYNLIMLLHEFFSQKIQLLKIINRKIKKRKCKIGKFINFLFHLVLFAPQ